MIPGRAIMPAPSIASASAAGSDGPTARILPSSTRMSAWAKSPKAASIVTTSAPRTTILLGISGLYGSIGFVRTRRHHKGDGVVTNVLEINPERLWDSLERSAEIGRFRDVGLRRLALSAEDKQMRDLFVEWAPTAGCNVEVDRLGNIFAR